MNDKQDPPPPGAQRLDATPAAAIFKGVPPLCSFCGRGKGEYRHLVAGPKGNICDHCVATARQQLGKGTKGPT
ncbi:MAG: ClpX C4-type zinc finger protein [Proteobacteria bacterium]|nr:ClpX C4-type zinc finger protein [Pseudomonadota bacterium]